MTPMPTVSFNRDVRVEDRIIDATVKCFQRYGINKTSMEDIAKTAKVSRPTIYRYFPSRHHLVVEVLVREVRDHTRLMIPVLREIKFPPQALVEGVVFAVSTALEHPYTQIVHSEAGAELLSKVPGTEQALLDAMGEQWLPWLTRWREAGYLRPHVRLDDLLLWITFYMHSTIARGFMAITEERIRRMLKSLLIPSIFDLEKLAVDFPDESL